MPLEQLGRYEIIGELGHGAMGVVYKARDPLIDRTVAIKTVSLELSREETEAFEHRFYREAKSAGRLNHANIVTIHDVGKGGAVAYIAMEFLQGRSLREILDSGVVLPPETIADIVAQVADGLAYAHDNGVVHRDIKPPNIMVLDSGLVKITDFGIALLPTGSSTVAGTVFGSPKYMSPEQVLGRAVDGRADIFSLGAVLYEMLTGFPPFFGGDLDAVLYQVINETPASPRSRNKAVAPVFDYIVAKAMAKDPNDRYANARAMASDLRNFHDFAIWRPKGETLAPLHSDTAAKTPRAAASQARTTTDSAISRRRRNLVIYGVPATLIAVVAGWAVVSKRPSGDMQLTLNQRPNTSAEKLAGTIPANPGPRDEPERVEGLATGQPEAAAAIAPPVTRQTKASAKPLARVALAVTPWGEVYVDGRKRGISPPLAEIRIAPGKHTVEIRNTTFQPYATTVDLAAEASLKIKHKFQ